MSLTPLRLHSEPYGSTGNIGENFRRLLGAPSMDPLQTVIREAVQNVADAAKLGTGPEIFIRIRRLAHHQIAVLREKFFSDLPVEGKSRTHLDEFLAREEPVVMEICDFATTGLGGPTRADRIPIGTTTLDFINFLRNIGTPRDTEHGGGTYGFGKVALYRMSRCSTILVDTLAAGDGAEARRLIGCHIGSSFERSECGMLRRYTGRHWWGVPDPDDSVVDPLTGGAAEEMATAVGFLPRGGNRTGTSIMILDLDTEGDELETIGKRVVEALLWNFWPRMMRDVPSNRRFHCTVEVDGVALDVPTPEDFAPLDLFAKAMRSARKGSGNDVRKITSQRPTRDLGWLAIEKGLRSQRRPLIGEESLFPAVTRHIALMRPVELVVRYLEGDPLPDERLEWAGVFIASSEVEVERAFADSEPPAHDDWIPENLPKGPAKTYVKVALRELKARAFELGNMPHGPGPVSASGPPLARVAGRLGAALEGVSGDGAGRNRMVGGGGGGARPPRARASRPIFVRLQRDLAGTTAIFATDVRQDAKRTGAILTAEAAVAIEGTAAGRIDDIILQPSIVSIRSVDGRSISASNTMNLEGAEGQYEIFVRMPPDCAVTVDAQVLTERDA